MNCRETRFILAELARDTEDQREYSTSALCHIEKCQCCRAALEQERLLAEKLNILAAATKFDASRDVEERLRAAFRRTAALRPVAPGPILGQHRPARLPLWAAGSIAAIFFLMVVILSFRPSTPKPTDTRMSSGQARTGLGANSAKEPVRIADQSTQVPLERIQRAALSARRRPAVVRRKSGSTAATRVSRQPGEANGVAAASVETSASAQESEVTSDFLSLGYGPLSNAVDGGQLIRVKMPRSSLLSFGLPMNVERASEPIQADVLVGQDGRARAIRFVNFTRKR